MREDRELERRREERRRAREAKQHDRKHRERQLEEPQPAPACTEEGAAVRIQSAWRGRRARQSLSLRSQLEERRKAAAAIQSAYRSAKARTARPAPTSTSPRETTLEQEVREWEERRREGEQGYEALAGEAKRASELEQLEAGRCARLGELGREDVRGVGNDVRAIMDHAREVNEAARVPLYGGFKWAWWRPLMREEAGKLRRSKRSFAA